MSKRPLTEIEVGSLWRFIRATAVSGYGEIGIGDIVMVVKVVYSPFVRAGGKEIPRWDITLLHKESTFNIKRAGIHIWHHHLEKVHKNGE